MARRPTAASRLTRQTAARAAPLRGAGAGSKHVFDEVLDEPFDPERDYLAHVDGKPRFDGVRLARVAVEPPPTLDQGEGRAPSARLGHLGLGRAA